MDVNELTKVMKMVSIIAIIGLCVPLTLTYGDIKMYYSDNGEYACQYTYQTYGEFIRDKDGYHESTNVITIDDGNVASDEILIDVISNIDNAIIAINYGGSYDDESIKMYSPVTNFKLTKSGIYYIAMNIDMGYGSDASSIASWVGTSKCFEKGKHYVVFYGNEINIEERYGMQYE